ncbi:MAG: hypothetical protein OCD01_04115 [Fibrobacterales bacterium]
MNTIKWGLVGIAISLFVGCDLMNDESGDAATGSNADSASARDEVIAADSLVTSLLNENDECVSVECLAAKDSLAMAAQNLQTVIEGGSYVHTVMAYDRDSVSISGDTITVFDKDYSCDNDVISSYNYKNNHLFTLTNNTLSIQEEWECEKKHFSGTGTTPLGSWSYTGEDYMLDSLNCTGERDGISFETYKLSEELNITETQFERVRSWNFNCYVDDFAIEHEYSDRPETFEKVDCSTWTLSINGKVSTESITFAPTLVTETKTITYKTHNCTENDMNEMDRRNLPVPTTCADLQDDGEDANECMQALFTEYCLDFPESNSCGDH